MSLAAVRTQAAAILSGVTFSDGKKLRASAYLTTDINPPHAIVSYTRGPRLTFGPSVSTKHPYTLIIQVFDQFDGERSSQARLDELVDHTTANALEALLETEANWAGVIDSCDSNTETTEPVTVEIANAQYLMVEFRFEVVF